MIESFRITTIGYWGAYPGPDAAVSSFLVQGGGKNVLIDCGSGVLQNLQTYLSPDNLDAVFITHYHADHSADIGCLQYAIRIFQSLQDQPSAPLPIYGHSETDDHHALTYKTNTIFCAYDEETLVDLGELTFRFFRTDHTEPSYALRLQYRDTVAVFSGDTAFCENLTKAAFRADVFYCESSLYNRFAGMVPGHLAAGEAGKTAREAGVKELVLTHLPHYGDHQDLVREAKEEFPGKVTLNTPGLLRQFPEGS
ncbi:MAG: MBL fold metallo-hydrolase [Spirochaetales bacterium]|nr:MBL fold metallo-hydrolase [Spirochaetales bacterium]